MGTDASLQARTAPRRSRRGIRPRVPAWTTPTLLAPGGLESVDRAGLSNHAARGRSAALTGLPESRRPELSTAYDDTQARGSARVAVLLSDKAGISAPLEVAPFARNPRHSWGSLLLPNRRAAARPGGRGVVGPPQGQHCRRDCCYSIVAGGYGRHRRSAGFVPRGVSRASRGLVEASASGAQEQSASRGSGVFIRS